MNLDLILCNLGLQHKCSQLRDKNVTSRTFSQMDGSAKQIIDISGKLGLTAEEVVKIKAHIEDHSSNLPDTPQQLQKSHFMTRQNHQNYTNIGRNFNQYRTNMAPNGAKSVEFRHAQKAQGHFMLGQKGSLMKQLNYGRKNRIQKLVNSTASVSPNAQNLARKSTQYQLGSLNQFLKPNRQSKLLNTNGKLSQQKDMIVNTQLNELQESVTKQAYIDKPLHSDSQSQNQVTRIENGANEIEKHQESYHFKNDKAEEQQIQLQSQIQAAQANQTEQVDNDDSHQNIHPSFGGNNQIIEQENTMAINGNQKSKEDIQARNPFEQPAQSEVNTSQVNLEMRDQSNQQQTETENVASKLDYLQELGTRQSQEYLSDKLQKVQNEQQDLEAEMFKNQTDIHQSQTLIQNDEQTDNQTTVIYQTNNQVANEVEMSELSDQEIHHEVDDQSLELKDKGNTQNDAFMRPQQPNYTSNQSQSQNLMQSQTMQSKQQQLSPSQSDLIDPDNRCENENYDNYNDYGPNEKQIINDQQAYSKQDLEDQNRSDDSSNYNQKQMEDVKNYRDEQIDSDQDEEDSNSKLSEEDLSEEQYNVDQQINQAQINSQSQHHSRPTIGMKQPAQHYVNQMPQANNSNQVRSIPSEEYSSSQNDQESENVYQQQYQTDCLNDQHAQHIDKNNANCSQEYIQDQDQEVESEFMDNITPRDHLNQFQDNQLNDQSSNSDQNYQNAEINQDKIYNGNQNSSYEDNSDEDNYDDQQMPEDTEYNKKVQLLHENRQKTINAQSLWATSKQNINSQQSNPQIQKNIQETTTNVANQVPQQSVDQDDSSKNSYSQQENLDGQTKYFPGQFAQGHNHQYQPQQVNTIEKQGNQQQTSKDVQQQYEQHMVLENEVDQSYSNNNQSKPFEELPFEKSEKFNTQQIQLQVLENKSNYLQASLNQSVNYDNQNDMLKNSSQNTFVDGAAIGQTEQNAIQGLIQQYHLINKPIQKQANQNQLAELQTKQVLNQIGAIQRPVQLIQSTGIQCLNMIPKYTDAVMHKQLVNKEVNAQEDLKQIMISDAVNIAKEATRKEVTEEVSKIVTQQVTDRVTQAVTQDVTAQVRSQTQSEMNLLHQQHLQALKDKYEQSAQHQNRREEKFHHQIGILESAVTDAQKQLEENNVQKNQLSIEKNELLAQINNLKENITQNCQELKQAEEQNEQAKQKHFQTIKQLIQEQQQDRSDIVIFRTQIQNLNEEIEKNQKNIVELKNQLENQNEKLSDQNTKYNMLDTQFKSMQQDINQKETTIHNLNLQIQQMKASYEQLEKQSQMNQDSIKAKARETEQQLQQTISDVKKERDQIILQKDNLEKQLLQAENETKLAIQREQQLLNQQKEREEQIQKEAQRQAQREASQMTPKQQTFNKISTQILTPQVQGIQMEIQMKNEFQSAKTDLENKIQRTSIVCPQQFQTEQKNVDVQNEQIHRDLQLKQEKLQQLLELQNKQDELKKLQQLQLSNQSKNASSPHSQGDTVSTQKPQHQVSATSHQSFDNDQVTQKQSKEILQQNVNQYQIYGQLSTDSKQQLNAQKTYPQNEQIPVASAHNVDLMDDANCDNYEQDQDEDNFLHTSGSKHRMPINKEESSFLPDCVVVEKEKKKKIIKKVRFHDDETLIDSNPKTGQDQVISYNSLSNQQVPVSVTQFTKTETMQEQIQSIGLKRMRNKHDEDQTEYEINDNSVSQDIFSASQGNEISSQQFNIANDAQLSKISDRLSSLNKTETDTNQIVQETSTTKVDNSSRGNQLGGYKRQRTAAGVDEQLHDPEILQNTNTKAGHQESSSVQQGQHEQGITKSTTGRQQLRRKTYQEDFAVDQKAMEDDDGEEFKSDKKSLRKKRKQTHSRGASVQNQQRTPKGQGAAGDHPKTNASGSGGQHKGGVTKHSQNCWQGSGSQQQASNAIDQKFKQFVGQNDQYLKKNPMLMSLIQKMQRK